MKLQPLGKRVLVRREPELTVSKGGIIIPDNCTEKPMEAIVIAVGDEVKKVNVDDRVLFAKFAGVEVTSNDDGFYLIMHESEILGKIV